MRKFFPAFLLTALVFAVYSPALRNGFVWDDTALILRDPLIRSWRLIGEGFQHFLFTDATASDFYRPIQRLTYTFDYAAFAFQPAGYHLTSIAWHAASTVALFLFAGELLRLFGIEDPKRRRLAFLVALAWAIHPVHTAAVVYISGRADPLAATFGFLGLYCAIRSLPAAGSKRWVLIIGAGALFLLGALSKETGIIFPFLWCAVLLLSKRWKEMVPALVTIVFVMLTYLSLRLPAEHLPAPRLHAPAPSLVRPVLVARALAEYTGLILLPVNLHMDRDVETHPEGSDAERSNIAARRELQTLLGIVLAGGAIYWLIRSRKQGDGVTTCLVLAFIAYLPVSGIFALNATVAEHWLYLPSAFLFLAAGLAISRFSISQAVLGSILLLWLVFLGARTWLRTFDWKDQRIFLERTMASGGNSPRMLINLAGLEQKEGQFDSARKHLAEALKKEPDQPLAILGLAALDVRQNNFDAARETLKRAVEMPLVEAKAHEMLAVLDYKEKGRIDVMRFRLAAHKGPPDWAIERRYIEALAQSDNTTGAISELKSCLTRQWYRAESWQMLSELLGKSGRTAEAAQARARAEAYDVHLGNTEAVPRSGP